MGLVRPAMRSILLLPRSQDARFVPSVRYEAAEGPRCSRSRLEASSENAKQLHPDAQMLADGRCTVLRRPVAARQ